MSKRSSGMANETQDSGEVYSYEESSDYTYDAADAQVYDNFSYYNEENFAEAYDLTWIAMSDDERMADLNTFRGLQGMGRHFFENDLEDIIY